MTYTPLLTVFFFLFCTPSIQAQDKLESPKDTLEFLIDSSNAAYDNFNYKDAIKYSSALIDLAKEHDQDYYTFLGYDMLGGIYLGIDDTIKGRVYSEKALNLARSTQQDSLIAWGTFNLGILYSDNEKTYPKAIRYFEESVDINEKMGELDEIYLIYMSMAWTYLDFKKFDKALEILLKADSISRKTEVDPKDTYFFKMLWGRYHLAQENYSASIRELESAAKKAEADSIIDLALESHEYLTEVYEKTGNFQEAYKNLDIFTEYQKQAYALEKIEETQKAAARFDLKQARNDLQVALREKEYSDQLISKSRTLSAILIAATIVLFLALLGLFKYFQTKKKYIGQLKNKNEQLILAKDKAENLSKVKTRFLSTVSHELRTPLYGVIGISSLLQQDKKLQDYEEDLESLKFSADYLLALVNDLLLLSKMDAEAIRLSKEPYMLESLIQKIVKSFEFSLQKNNNTLHLEIDDAIPDSVIGDPIRLSQILINLIGNAIKFNQNGNIWVRLELVDILESGQHKIRFTIKDDGPGIALDKQKIIFKEFSQINQNNQNYKGTGLGLTIVKKLLKLHKSKIHLKSSPGEGAEFSFSLDLNKSDDKLDKKIELTDNGINEYKKLRGLDIKVLVVDDNKINQRITQKILERYQIESNLANNGQQAVNLHRSQGYDLILMDINMPEIDGTEAAQMIRKFDSTTPIIALTAVELDEMRKEILDSGITDIIHKPFDIKNFLNTLLKNLLPAG